MRRRADPAAGTELGRVRVVIEFAPGEHDRIQGFVSRDGDPALPFDGWLELLAHLEAVARSAG